MGYGKITQNDVDKLRSVVLNCPQPIRDNPALKYVATSFHGSVYRYGKLVVKKTRKQTFSKSYVDTMLEKSAVGAQRGYDFAPYLDFFGKDNDYMTMPYLSGKVLREGEAKVDQLLNIGTDGLTRYYENFLGLTEIGLDIDNFRNSNFILGNLEVKSTLWSHLVSATQPLCYGVYERNTDKVKLLKSRIKKIIGKYMPKSEVNELLEYAGGGDYDGKSNCDIF
jgi:hypothetical protein